MFREFGARSHSNAHTPIGAETGTVGAYGAPRASEKTDPLPGVVHVLNGQALTDKGRILLAQANKWEPVGEVNECDILWG